MHVVIITYSYPPEDSIFSPDVAEEFLQRGHEVTVFAPFPNRPGGKVYKGYRRCWRSVGFVNGCRVVRSWHTLSGRSTMLSRFTENISFGLTSTIQLLWYLFTRTRPNVAFLKTWSIFAQNFNSFILRLWGVPIVSCALDIYPDSLVDKKMLKPTGIVARTMLWLDKLHMRRCHRIITPSLGMAELLARTRGVPLSKVEYIPNYADPTLFLQPLSSLSFRQKHGIPPDVFIAMFAGSLTLSAGLKLYIEVAERLRSEDDIRILIVGDGASRVELEHEITERKLNNIRVIHPLKPTEVPEVQAAANVMLLSLMGDMALSAVPSKLVYYMLSGKPVIASVVSENYAAKILQESDSGFVVPPEDPAAVAAVLRDIRHKPDLLRQMGENARRFALKEFSRDVVIPKLVNMIESVARG